MFLKFVATVDSQLGQTTMSGSSLTASKSAGIRRANNFIPELSRGNIQTFDGLYETVTRQHEANTNKNNNKKDVDVAENDVHTDPTPHLFMHSYDPQQQEYYKDPGAELDTKKAMEWSRKQELQAEAKALGRPERDAKLAASADVKMYKGKMIRDPKQAKPQLLANNYYKYKSSEELTKLKQDEHRELIIMYGNSMGTFYRGEGWNAFSNRYLLLEKIMFEQHEDLEGLKESHRQMMLKAKKKTQIFGNNALAPIEKVETNPSTARSSQNTARTSRSNISQTKPSTAPSGQERGGMPPLYSLVEQQQLMSRKQRTDSSSTFLTEVAISNQDDVFKDPQQQAPPEQPMEVRNFEARLALLNTIKRRDKQRPYEGALKFPLEELQESNKRLERIKTRGETLSKSLNMEEAEDNRDLDKIFPEIKMKRVGHHGYHGRRDSSPGVGVDNLMKNLNFDHLIHDVQQSVGGGNVLDHDTGKALDEIQQEKVDTELHKIDALEGDLKTIMDKHSSILATPQHEIPIQILPTIQIVQDNAPEIQIGDTMHKSTKLDATDMKRTKRRKLKPYLPSKNIQRDNWKRQFIATQAQLQHNLLNCLDERDENRRIVYASKERLGKVSSDALDTAKLWALYRTQSTHSAPEKVLKENLWGRSREELRNENAKFMRAVLFYRRLIVFLDFLHYPTQPLQARFLNNVRSLLIEQPTFMFHSKKLLPEALGMFGDKINTFLENKESLKLIQFMCSEMNIKGEDFFKLIKDRDWKIKTKDMLDLRAKMKEAEEQQSGQNISQFYSW
jgi:hypothetical protein